MRRQRLEGGQAVAYLKERSFIGRRHRTLHHGASGAGAQCLTREVVAVAVLTVQREEQIGGGCLTRINDGPAERSGMQKGDLVLKVDDKPLCGVDDLHRLLTAEVAGKPMTIELVRSGRLVHLSVIPIADDERAAP